MRLTEHVAIPGEHKLLLQGLVGQIEAILTVPDKIKHKAFAFLGHPHSLQGGTMNNKVVTTIARAFKEIGIPSLRFNFRGVGLSAGTYSQGIGESEDMLCLVKQWQKEEKGGDLEQEVQSINDDEPVSNDANNSSVKSLIFAGFSFGSYVAYRTASQCDQSMLITIAPAVHHYDYQEFHPVPHPWLIIQGDADEVVPCSSVVDFAKQHSPCLPLIEFFGTGHFFHGKLLQLKAELMNYMSTQMQVRDPL
jgi:alpha/beta superfamily hydrolase